jgi:hypothetical protein
MLVYLPVVGSVSKYLQVASLTVFRLNSAEVPPITTARWYGGHACVPNVWKKYILTKFNIR